MKKNARYDFIVVGAGIAGLSAAYHLGKDGYRVIVLERSDWRGGASYQSTAEMNHDPDADWAKVISRFGIKGAKEVWKLSDFAYKLLTDFAHRPRAVHFETRRLPGHFFSYRKKDSAAIRRKYELYKKLGAHVSFTEKGDAFHESFQHVLTILDEGQTNNQAILKTLRAAIRKQGGIIRDHTSVRRISTAHGRAEAITEKGELFEAHRVIVATGNAQLLPSIKHKIGSVRTFVVSYKKHGMRKLFRSSVLSDNDNPYHYIRSFSGVRLWIGGVDDKRTFKASVEKKRYKLLDTYAHDVLHIDR